MKVKLVFILVFSYLSACSATRSSDVKPIDPILTAKLVVNSEDTEKYWETTHIANPKFPASEARGRSVYVCVSVAFIIDEDGNVHNPTIATVYPERNEKFERAAINAILEFKYRPSISNTDRVRIITSNAFAFMAPPAGMDKEEIDKMSKELLLVCKVDLTK